MTTEEVSRLIERLTERVKTLEHDLDDLESRFWDLERDSRYHETDISSLRDDLSDHEHE